MKKVLVNGNESTDSRILVDNQKVEVFFSGENVPIFGDHNTFKTYLEKQI